MIYLTDDADISIGPVGEVTQEPGTNKAIDRNEASKIANLLEGLRFPATKEQIKKYIEGGKSITISAENARDTSQSIEDNLKAGKKYNSTYEIEKALSLVAKEYNNENRNREKRRRKKILRQ
jgi:hypothetical protein